MSVPEGQRIHALNWYREPISVAKCVCLRPRKRIQLHSHHSSTGTGPSPAAQDPRIRDATRPNPSHPVRAATRLGPAVGPKFGPGRGSLLPGNEPGPKVWRHELVRLGRLRREQGQVLVGAGNNGERQER